jgi:hypothetical protein
MDTREKLLKILDEDQGYDNAALGDKILKLIEPTTVTVEDVGRGGISSIATLTACSNCIYNTQFRGVEPCGSCTDDLNNHERSKPL